MYQFGGGNLGKIESILIKLNKNKYLFWSIVACIFISTVYLTSKTQYYADDYNYKFIWGTNKEVKSVIDIFISQYNHYFQWGGRTVAHILVQLFLFVNKWWFNIINSLVFTALNIIIYRLALGKKIKYNYDSLNISIIYLILWNCIPNFGECILWLTGSINYLWTATIILVFLVPYINLYNKYNILEDSKINIIIMFVAGIIVGWTNENSSIAVIIAIVGVVFYYKKIRRVKLNRWVYSGICGMIIGFFIMVIAPGNFKRASNFKISIIEKVINYITSFESNIQLYGELFFVILVIVIGYLFLNIYKEDCIHSCKSNYEFIGILFITAVISIGAMIASPSFPSRSMFFSSILIIVAISSLLFKNKDKLNFIMFRVVILIPLLMLFTLSFGKTIIKLNRLEDIIVNRIEYIESSKANGEFDIVTTPINMVNDQHVFFVDLSIDKSDWKNRSMSKYFNINSIRIDEKIN